MLKVLGVLTLAPSIVTRVAPIRGTVGSPPPSADTNVRPSASLAVLVTPGSSFAS